MLKTPSPSICKRKESFSELVEEVISQVTFEIEQIDQMFVVYADLLERARQGTPNLVEMTAMASVLHSFYNGLENIFLSIAKGLDSQVPTDSQWHRDLLLQMTQETTNRSRVISAELVHTSWSRASWESW